MLAKSPTPRSVLKSRKANVVPFTNKPKLLPPPVKLKKEPLKELGRKYGYQRAAPPDEDSSEDDISDVEQVGERDELDDIKEVRGQIISQLYVADVLNLGALRYQ